MRHLPFFLFPLIAPLLAPIALHAQAAATSSKAAPAKSTFTYLDDEAEAGGFDISATAQKFPLQFIIAQQENGDGYLLKATTNSIELGLRRKNVVQPLALSRVPLSTGSLVIQRRGQKLRVLNGNHTVLEAEDDTWQEGQIGFQGAVKDARVQPVEEIFFDDDFMRVKEEVAVAAAKDNPKQGIRVADVKSEETLWKAAVGSWVTTGLSENAEAQVAQSANAFAFRANTTGTNLALAGRPFWNDYVAEVSVRPEGATAVGLASNAQDAQNYLLLHWTEGESGKVQLRAVVNGKSRVLDEAIGGFEAKQWYRLRVALAGNTVRAWIDDTEVLRANTGFFGRGMIGVYTENPKPDATADFDDVSVRSSRDVHEDFSRRIAGRWQTVAGKWNLQNAATPADARGSYAVMGEGEWSDYQVGAQMEPRPDAVTGLVLNHQSGKGAYVLRVAGSKAKVPFAGKTQIVKIAGNKTTVLAETTSGARFDSKPQSWTFTGEDGYLQARVDGKAIIDAFDESFKTGRAGLFAQRGASGAPQVRNFVVEFPRQRATWAKVPELYEQERQAETMGGWSTPQGFWVNSSPVADSKTPVATSNAPTTSPKPDNKTLWHKGTFWGDGRLQFNLPDLGNNKTFDVLLNTVPTGQSPGAASPALKLSLSLDKSTLKANLTRQNGKTAGSWNGTTKLDGAPTKAIVEVQNRGNYIIVRLRQDKDLPQSTLLAARVS